MSPVILDEQIEQSFSIFGSDTEYLTLRDFRLFRWNRLQAAIGNLRLTGPDPEPVDAYRIWQSTEAKAGTQARTANKVLGTAIAPAVPDMPESSGMFT